MYLQGGIKMKVEKLEKFLMYGIKDGSRDIENEYKELKRLARIGEIPKEKRCNQCN